METTILALFLPCEWHWFLPFPLDTVMNRIYCPGQGERAGYRLPIGFPYYTNSYSTGQGTNNIGDLPTTKCVHFSYTLGHRDISTVYPGTPVNSLWAPGSPGLHYFLAPILLTPMAHGVVHNGTLGHQMSVSVQIPWPTFFKFPASHPFSCLVTQVMAMDSFLKRAGDDTTKYTRYNVADLQSMAQVQKLGKEWWPLLEVGTLAPNHPSLTSSDCLK